jgi:hypothetical protein
MAFLQSTNPPERKFGLAHKPVGVIAHGGQKQSEEALGYYKAALLDPLSNALGSVGMKVIGVKGQIDWAGVRPPNTQIFGSSFANCVSSNLGGLCLITLVI